jgi:hypothetical protein
MRKGADDNRFGEVVVLRRIAALMLGCGRTLLKDSGTAV